jgi:hypothetical protein
LAIEQGSFARRFVPGGIAHVDMAHIDIQLGAGFGPIVRVETQQALGDVQPP